MPRGSASEVLYDQHPDVPARCTDVETPEDRRHKALLRMLGHVKDAVAFPLDKRELLRAICMAGYNANPSLDDGIRGASPGAKAMWADQDAEALMGVASDDDPVGE